MSFLPRYTITAQIARCLLRIEAAREHIRNLPLTVPVLASLRESARLFTTHYSTMIEGNRLSSAQVAEVVAHKGHFPGRERDENEVLGYYAALEHVERSAAQRKIIDHLFVRTLHALVMSDGIKEKNRLLRRDVSLAAIAPASAARKDDTAVYRDGQNIIRDQRTGAIIYLPPEASDVPDLMKNLIEWIIQEQQSELPCPLIAAIAHYQFVTIHPFFDGNGRTARLITTFILQRNGYDLKGLYSLEEYYARNLGAYYEAMTIGPSHNYYLGRAEADITKWIEYFVEGMAHSCEAVLRNMEQVQHRALPDQSSLLRLLDSRQRKILELFCSQAIITARQVGERFGFQPRTSALLCKKWVESGFLEVVDASNRARSYRLSAQFQSLIS